VGAAKDKEKVVDKVKMMKEVTTRITIHAVEDAVVEEAADQIGTILIVIIMANMVIMQVNVIPRRMWRRMLIL
jgi:DNA integrity scanning protein DisA with diadenylate cyclase activity